MSRHHPARHLVFASPLVLLVAGAPALGEIHDVTVGPDTAFHPQTVTIAVGDTVRIGDQTWTITALGEVAEKNLANLGHVTLVFDGETEPRMPGAVHLTGVDEATAEQATRQAIPALLGGMQANAEDPAGAMSLAGALGDHPSDS